MLILKARRNLHGMEPGESAANRFLETATFFLPTWAWKRIFGAPPELRSK